MKLDGLMQCRIIGIRVERKRVASKIIDEKKKKNR